MASKGSVDPRLRNLKIKTGVVKRLAKEKTMYEKEVVDQDKKIEKMKTEGKDEYDIKKQIEVLQESKNMIPDCQRRLQQAHVELTALLQEVEDLKDSEEYKAAEDLLKEISL